MRIIVNGLLIVSLLMLFVTNLWAQTDTVSVIFVTDTHSHLTPWGKKDVNGKGTRGGIARVATVVKQLQNTEKNTIFVHSGDLFVGDFMFNKFFGVPEFELLTDLGLRVMTVGNHEFDLTPARFKATIAEANLTSTNLDLISANLDMSADPELAAVVKPFTVVQAGNVKVGFFGLTPDMANTFSSPAPDSITDYIQAASAAVGALSSQCDAIIGLTHLNTDDDDTLAARVDGVDLIIGGHAHVHNFEPKIVNNTPIIRAGCFYKYVGLARLEVSSAGLKILHHELIPIDSTVAEDPAVAAIVDSLVAEVEADPKFGPVFTEIVGENTTELANWSGTGFRDAPLGNLITDAMREVTGTQLALDVHGWMGQPLCEGPLVGNDIFQSIPYGWDEETGLGYELVTFTIIGYMLQSAIEFVLNESQYDSSFDLQISGGQIIFDSRKPMGSKIESFTIGGEPLGVLSTYSVTVSDGLAKFMYLAGLSFITPDETGLMEYNVVRDFIAANSPVTYTAEGRIQDVAETSVAVKKPVGRPFDFTLYQNYPNPFNSETVIKYQIHQNGNVALKVYNNNGQFIKTLFTGEQIAGVHTAKWDGKNEFGFDVASGVYVLKLLVEDLAKSAKMVLIR